MAVAKYDPVLEFLAEKKAALVELQRLMVPRDPHVADNHVAMALIDLLMAERIQERKISEAPPWDGGKELLGDPPVGYRYLKRNRLGGHVGLYVDDKWVKWVGAKELEELVKEGVPWKEI